MIPREILKKIRQIEIRTNRIVARIAERGSYRRTGVAPGSDFKTPALAESAATAVQRPQTAGGILEDGDRRDACPTPSPGRTTPGISNALTNQHALRLGLRPKPRSVLSLTPGFSPVTGEGAGLNRFSGFSRTRKPLKRLDFRDPTHTGLKPGANEKRILEESSFGSDETNQVQPNFCFISA